MPPRPVVVEHRFLFNVQRNSDFPTFLAFVLASRAAISHAKRGKHEETAFCVWLLRNRLQV